VLAQTSEREVMCPRFANGVWCRAPMSVCAVRVPNRRSPVKTLAACFLALTFTTAAHAAFLPPRVLSGDARDFALDMRAAPTILAGCARSVNGAYGFYGDVGWSVAQSFTPRLSGRLTSIITGMTGNNYEAFVVTARLYTDDGSGHPGTLLATSDSMIIAAPPPYPEWTNVEMTFPDPAVVTAGTSYVVKWTSGLGEGVGYVIVHQGRDGCPGGHLSQSVDFEQTWNDVLYADQRYGALQR
jgi:hypothetical protein